eukprot:247176-Pyramimonas_sp.AAC.1
MPDTGLLGGDRAPFAMSFQRWATQILRGRTAQALRRYPREVGPLLITQRCLSCVLCRPHAASVLGTCMG